MFQKYFSLFAFMIGIISCKRCIIEDCRGYETITLYLVHYQQSEADSVLIKKYKQNTNYTELVDSLYAQDSYYYGDTMSLGFIDRQGNSLESLNTEYDLEIINQFDNKVIRISDIKREKATQEICTGGLFGGKSTQPECNNKLISYNYAVNSGNILSTGNLIYVVK
jgi:hypothetical protein